VKNKNMQMTDPHVIQKWPGNAGTQSDKVRGQILPDQMEFANKGKVPTVVAYSNGALTSWGFLASQDPDYPSGAHDWFKVYFDPEEYKRARDMGADNVPSSHGEVRRWYRDFLMRLNAEIERQLEGRIGSTWSRATVEFLFSVPTTWTAINVINDFEKLVREAGFGRGGPNHTCAISLTEAEAAAVHTFKTGAVSYSDGDIILIVDAGGGTTDLALLKADVKEGKRPRLEGLDSVRGDEIGSVLIDLSFEELAKQRLARIAPRLRKPVDEFAWDMMKYSFVAHKVEFGTEHSDYQNIKLMGVPGLGEEFDAPEAGIRNGKMRFTKWVSHRYTVVSDSGSN
jgi:hypothetical protein